MMKNWCNAFAIFCVCILSPFAVLGYNLDLDTYIKHNGQPGSMFGFSIALHKTYVAGRRTNWVIVGAPRGNTSEYQPQIERAGAVYKCDIADDDRCVMVPFDSKGNQYNDRGEQIDTKSNQWLGATVASSGENGVIVACAPRYVFHTMTPRRVERIEPVGTCFTSTNFTSFTEFSPCRTSYWGYHRQGSCQAGFSAALTKKGERLFIGAPGSWYWQGQTYTYDITNPRNKVYSTGESVPKDDDTYLGYSMATGDFDGDGEEDVAIGMPRGSELLGRIVLYKWNMVNILNITGWQIGAYFGYSLCTVDVNGDKLDDLIIGAPMYSEPNNEGKYEVGRVYIMLQGRKENFVREEFRDGVNSRGRFGLALTSLDDINQDGFGDFAVGAPYDGPNGRGAVYIYHGSADGPLVKPSQVIYAEDVIGATYPRTFGFSLSGGVDMDGNLYPDLAVGAYDSDSVIVFKSRPVAVVDATTSFISQSKLISLDEKRCRTSRNVQVACTEFESCLKYNGINLPYSLDFQVSWVLDAKKTKNPRMYFLYFEGRNVLNSTYRLERGKPLCVNQTVYLVDGIRDKLTPLEVEMRYQLRTNRVKSNTRQKRAALEPVIDQNREIVQRDSMNIQKNCGLDNVCVPDLRLEIKTVDKFLLGSRDPLYIEVLISNFGEDAFEAGYYMTLPKDLDFKKIQQIGDARDLPITCTAPTPATNYTLKCDIGNPLPAGKVAKFKVVMMPTQKVGMAPSYDFYMEANSTNHEADGSRFDNIISKSIGIWVETDLAIEGTSLPDFEHYKASDFKSLENSTKEGDLGPHVVHIYNIRNNGPSTIEEAVVHIFYPYQTQGDDTLMYLLNQPETDGNIQCDPSIDANPRNLELDQTLSRRSYLESIGAVVKTSGSSYSHVEQSSSGGRTTISHGSGKTTKILTKEEERKLAEEENVESTGDASFVHTQRAKEAASAAALSGRQSWNSSSSGGPAFIVTSSRNRSVSYDPQGRPHVVETSTEYYHNVNSLGDAGRTRYQQNANVAYAQAGGASGRSGEVVGRSGYSASSGQTGGNYYQGMSNERGGSAGSYQSGSTQSRGRGFNDLSATSNFEKAAQGGHGFQAGVLDLGTLNRNNVDDEVRHRAGSSGAGAGHTSYSQSGFRGGSTGGGAHGQYHSTHYSGGSTSGTAHDLNADEEGYYYDDGDDVDNNHFSTSSSQQQHYGGGSTYQHRNREQIGRLKRQSDPVPDSERTDPCTATKCAALRCVVKNLGNNDGAWIAIRTRLVAKTMEKLASNVPLNVSTMAVSSITRLPYIGVPKDQIKRSHEIFYKAVPEPIPVPDVVPLWVVVLSACAGAIILLLLVFLLYKCGFFKRNRPTDSSQERQPLRNGYHGDEHL